MPTTTDFTSPLVWAVLIGWILSVVLHEFAHGLVGYLGGDYTVRERGGLSLNPLQYIDPMMSLVIPAVMLLMGGIPLPGGVTYIRRDLLRSKAWSSAVSLAGPAMNLLLFFACMLPLHPKFGWFDPDAPQPAHLLLATLGRLQFLGVMLNLMPIPPLDGFQAISPYLPSRLRTKLMTPPTSTILFFGFFLILWRVPMVIWQFDRLGDAILEWLGFSKSYTAAFERALYTTLFSKH